VSTVSHGFRAMGTRVTLIAAADADPGAFADAARIVERVFHREELRFSRFREESELSRVNARSGRWTAVSRGFADLLRYSLEAARWSGGLFDPTVLSALVAAGYDRDFDEVIAGAREALHPTEPCGRWREVEVDADRVRLPEGAGLDFGGVAKGWTVDLAADAVVSATGLPWAVVNAGGDLRVTGSTPAAGVVVAIEDPTSFEDELWSLALVSGAIATSSVTSRAWGPGLHHVIDPRTGASAATGVLQATVWSETCAEAEIRAKWALLEGPSVLEHVTALLVTDDGRILMNIEIKDLAEVGA
jgi:thiamine biosynthesis lipoprotein